MFVALGSEGGVDAGAGGVLDLFWGVCVGGALGDGDCGSCVVCVKRAILALQSLAARSRMAMSCAVGVMRVFDRPSAVWSWGGMDGG